MMANNEPHFLSKKFETHLRQQSARGSQLFICPFCSDERSFQREHNLWTHVQSCHADQLPAPHEHAATIELRKWLKQHAHRKLPAANSQSRPKGEKVHLPPSSSSSPFKSASDEPSKVAYSPGETAIEQGITSELSDIGNLSLENRPDEKVKEDSRPRNARKRATGAARAAAEEDNKPTAEHGAPRRSKARSYEPRTRQVVDPDFDRSAPLYGGSGDGLARAPRSNPKRLFDPNLDDPTVKMDANNKAAASPRLETNAHGFLEKDDHPRRRKGRDAIQGQSGPRNWSNHKKQPSRKQPGNAQTASGNPRKEAGLRYKGAIAEGPGAELFLQPETRPISEEQLAAELKSIYAALEMAEAKAIEVDNNQMLSFRNAEGEKPKMRPERWRAYFDLHRALLYEHHDFFLASQHPSASASQRRLAAKHAMPARMWRYGIHSFLEILRDALPDSRDLMLSFIYLAYSVVALLYETVSTFENTWIECLGDLARYRMAIEDKDPEDREIWTGVARLWYSKAADKLPQVGRLYHHLAILARPDVVQQLFLYAKALSVVHPFSSARESILTLFDMISRLDEHQKGFGHIFVQAHGILFAKANTDGFLNLKTKFLNGLDDHIGCVTKKWKEQGVFIAISNFAAMSGFGSEDISLMQKLEWEKSNPSGAKPVDTFQPRDSSRDTSFASFKYAKELAFSVLKIALERIGDGNVLPHVHVSLVFLYHLSSQDGALATLASDIPWGALVTMLNSLLLSEIPLNWMEGPYFPAQEGDDRRPLPEDYHMRGLLWTINYFPDAWFTDVLVDNSERFTEQPSMTPVREARILWLAHQISKI
ncbi:hypothetical protein L228DRAFT_139580 [Xylona heveae TC161]|uniref:DNA/RNA-binding domain-containing protein n=1 Tax=Xylona heveae (strain CBS 132557 / TC161) TaxID=1328760 RepID=A0A165H319_XYLHT|nr:hypothetical protein L228DRAFT_139580 [Xylona heveae TC161]KZF22918.1 hypothetical protein L228DRAFT_139580 [Xylona heveae TC161]